jgi:4-alpha-glucanotransferase
MNKVYFGICLHFHQPVGNFDNIIERAYQNCYKSFLDVFERYPDIKMSMHFSGCLLDYFEDKHPDYLERIRVMVDRGQVEIIGGGYYEPIFTSIPEKDRLGQIKMMSGYIKKRFGQKAQGMWTPERVWVPELAKDFNKAGMKYTILDDEHFVKAGLSKDELFGYFTTGGKDKGIAVFPSNKPLRYMIPFKMPHEIINYFRDVSSKTNEPMFTYGDDAEKFGEWPFTYDWVYKQEWLSKFFDELSKNKDWVVTVKLSDYLKSNAPIKKINIPEASYQEMMEWSGGSWMNFLKKYPETNQMVRKMHYVSEKVNSTENASALRELYKGQCNCSYWHGVFGGLYLYHLRKAIYEHLINAEKIADKILHKNKKGWTEIKEIDFYENAKKAFILENEEVSLCVDPETGAIIRELDVKKVSTNIVNSIGRHEEEYHKKILAKMGKSDDAGAVRTIHEDVKTMDPGLNSEFCYDNYIRGCLIDHFIDESSSIDSFMNCKSKELGDFINAGYKAKKEKDKVVFTRKGKVNGKDISITKEIKLKGKKEIEVSYSLKNLSKGAIHSVFGVEFNLTMPYLNSDKYNYFACDKALNNLNEKGCVSNTDSFSIKDYNKELDINFIFSKKPESIWYFPVKTVSQSERAYELNFQASCVLPRWHINIPSAKELNFNIILSF